MWYDAMALAYKLFAHSFCLKAYSFFCMATLRNAQTKIANLYWWEQSCDTMDDMIPRYGMYAMEGVSMITNVHK